MSQPISTRLPEVRVEYDYRNGYRVIRYFKDARKARSFYVRQDKLGNNPKVVKETKMSEGPATPATDDTTPIATKPARKTPKKAEKKTVKKTVKKTTKKVTKKTAPRADRNGPSPNELKILQAMRKVSKPVNRTQLKESTGIVKGYSKLLGTNENPSENSLQGRGLVRLKLMEDGYYYELTAAGKKAASA